MDGNMPFLKKHSHLSKTSPIKVGTHAHQMTVRINLFLLTPIFDRSHFLNYNIKKCKRGNANMAIRQRHEAQDEGYILISSKKDHPGRNQ